MASLLLAPASALAAGRAWFALENPTPFFPAALLNQMWKGDGEKGFDAEQGSATHERARSRARPP